MPTVLHFSRLPAKPQYLHFEPGETRQAARKLPELTAGEEQLLAHTALAAASGCPRLAVGGGAVQVWRSV